MLDHHSIARLEQWLLDSEGSAGDVVDEAAVETPLALITSMPPLITDDEPEDDEEEEKEKERGGARGRWGSGAVIDQKWISRFAGSSYSQADGALCLLQSFRSCS